MDLVLHPSGSDSALSSNYRRAFAQATTLFVVSAYLTEWNKSLKLGPNCDKFRIIVGKDFGVTRKSACVDVLKWLPNSRKGEFLVADGIAGFHPKAIFWREASNRAFAIVGSSNLTRAAFSTNHEANGYCEINSNAFDAVEQWIARIESSCVPVSEDWLARYHEARPSPGRSTGPRARVQPTIGFPLPRPAGMVKLINRRRRQLTVYAKQRNGLLSLFRQCAEGEISNADFYQRLPSFWSSEIGDRLQGAGWERKGANSNFRTLSKSFLRIVEATSSDRDDVVIREIDRLGKKGVPSRKAFLSEMLCLRFPSEYPVLNYPIVQYLRAMKFRAPRSATEGVKYIDLAKKLRFSLRENPDHPAKNIAELDTVIWKKYGK
ncbi:MAG: hypothetical protein EPO10_16940 [Reyranella sp.]|uniref:phospholipase D family protein n=1 Tax=Reyranella sp. TaxID=1929291 RepID=UPI0012276207|nr:phospholipase D family protein [Reyranella sp.]TAJ98102.1 MAG: hypothetical protein EPO41_01195 [Reyranella sp.]TBR27672.1 MAG: hypothetical protein EPO10_16940 [Reyranella sp.]